MGIAEMKLENAGMLREVLSYLSHLSQPEEDKTLHLDRHYNKAKEQYGNVLAKLAQ